MKIKKGGIFKSTDKIEIEEFPKNIKERIYLISTDPHNINTYGTAFYRLNKYPGDIDIFENLYYDTNLKDAIINFRKTIQKIVRNVQNTENMWFLELKCGVDYRYISGYFSDNIDDFYYYHKIFTEDLNKKGLLEKETYDELNELFKKKDKCNLSKIREIYRNLYIIRWEADEILNNKKVLNKNVVVTLDDCIQDNSMIKFDTTAYVNGRFIEFSNYFDLWHTTKGKYEKTNINIKFINGIEYSLIIEINKFMYDCDKFDYYKVAKRLWALARTKGDKKMINKLSPLFLTDIAPLGQIKSDIGALVGLLQYFKRNKIKLTTDLKNKMFEQLQNNKYILSHLITLDLDIKLLNNKLDNMKFDNIDNLIKELKEIKNYFKLKTDKYTLNYFEKHKLLPLPNTYLITKPIKNEEQYLLFG